MLENLRGCGLGGFECDEVFESKNSVLNGFESIQLKMTMQTFRSRDFANISLFWAGFVGRHYAEKGLRMMVLLGGLKGSG